MVFGLPPGEQMLTYLVAGRNNSTTEGERRFNFVWYRPADEQKDLPVLFTDADGRRHEQNIPPDRIRKEVVMDMHATAARLLAPAFVDVIRATSDPLFQPIYDLESPQLVFGRAVLMGDAAFVARPHVGLGVTKAAGDAVTRSMRCWRTPMILPLPCRSTKPATALRTIDRRACAGARSRDRRAARRRSPSGAH